MAIELARTQALPRPWGIVDPSPWYHAAHDAAPIPFQADVPGELALLGPVITPKAS